MRAALGSVAAEPGTSSHGTGLALDVPELPCEYGWDTPQRDWLVANGPAYGWVSPSWAGRAARTRSTGTSSTGADGSGHGDGPRPPPRSTAR